MRPAEGVSGTMGSTGVPVRDTRGKSGFCKGFPTYLGNVVLTLSSGGAQHELGVDGRELGDVLREVGELFGGVLLVGGGSGGGEPLLPGGRLGPSERVPF